MCASRPGAEDMSDELQALCFMAGANSIFYGEKLLTTGNPDVERDRRLFERLGLKPEPLAGWVDGDCLPNEQTTPRARYSRRKRPFAGRLERFVSS